MTQISDRLEKVAIQLKANIYFDGGVVSYSLFSEEGKKKTIGLIRQGEYHFNTEAPEQMDIISGVCRVKLAGEKDWKMFSAQQSFKVPGKSSFDIAVDSGFAEYLCIFL